MQKLLDACRLRIVDRNGKGHRIGGTGGQRPNRQLVGSASRSGFGPTSRTTAGVKRGSDRKCRRQNNSGGILPALVTVSDRVGQRGTRVGARHAIVRGDKEIRVRVDRVKVGVAIVRGVFVRTVGSIIGNRDAVE